jgi:DNA polymerase delta subunit 4
MPPRRSTRRAASGGQSTLSFGAQSRVTKPSATAPGKQVKNIKPKVEEISKVSSPDTAFPQQIPVTSSAASSKPHIAELAIREQAKDELSQPASEEDRKALKISEAQITRYWDNEEQNRIAPRGMRADYLADTTYSLISDVFGSASKRPRYRRKSSTTL